MARQHRLAPLLQVRDGGDRVGLVLLVALLADVTQGRGGGRRRRDRRRSGGGGSGVVLLRRKEHDPLAHQRIHAHGARRGLGRRRSLGRHVPAGGGGDEPQRQHRRRPHRQRDAIHQ